MAKSFIQEEDFHLTSEPSLGNGIDYETVESFTNKESSLIDEINEMMKMSLQLHSNPQTEENNEEETIERSETHGFLDAISKRVCQFALKLGYDNHDIMEAASKVSMTNQMLNEDTLLQELVKQSPYKVKPLKLNLTGDENELMTKVVKTVTELAEATSTLSTSTLSTSSSELHSIVVDGSNVAMWYVIYFVIVYLHCLLGNLMGRKDRDGKKD